MTDTLPRVSPWNLANYLTVLRLLLVPVFLAFLLADDGEHAGYRLSAAGVFLLAALTDRIDGQIARSRGLITSFGTLADPIADKALIGAALIGLSLLDELPWWVTVVVLVREIGVTLLRFVVIRHGVMPSGRGGKLKTVLQTVAITLYLLPLTGLLHAMSAVVMGLAVLLTVVTGIEIVVKALVLRTTSERADMKRAARS
jgi:CDP-diacylglycerol--glycerol-3-phosphate 3-phosphatidyltransferase